MQAAWVAAFALARAADTRGDVDDVTATLVLADGRRDVLTCAITRLDELTDVDARLQVRARGLLSRAWIALADGPGAEG
jgi:hypothetical protein